MLVPSLQTGAGVSGAYALVFGVAALACFASVGRVSRIEDDDTRRGLVALLLTSGGWAVVHVAFLVAPSPALKLAAYYAGLVVGFATVGPWLYFCSAFSGRSLHRARTLQWLALAVFLVVTAVKLTNPIHGLYFRAEFVATPFTHLAVDNLALHWLAMGLAYALATVGYFIILELFWQVDHDTTPLLALVGVTSFPLVLDIAGEITPLLLDITYGPLGVAAFAVGVAFLYLEDFQTIKLAGESDDPVIVLDDEGRVRDFNDRAREVFPDVAVDEYVDAIAPEVAPFLDADDGVIRVDRIGGMRYYHLSTNPFSTDSSRLGQVITLTDVTEREQYRAELERQNERLEQFASMVSHDLRNPLNVAMGRIEVAREEHDNEHLEKAVGALDRMEALIDDLLALARQGQPIDETERASLPDVVRRSWDIVDTREATLALEADLVVEADPDRLQQLLENLFRNSVEHGSTGNRPPADDSVEHGGTDVTVRVGALENGSGFYVEDDGPGIPAEERDTVFESGYSTADDGTGFGLAIVAEIVEAHGWYVEATAADSGGTQFEITGVDTVE